MDIVAIYITGCCIADKYIHMRTYAHAVSDLILCLVSSHRLRKMIPCVTAFIFILIKQSHGFHMQTLLEWLIAQSQVDKTVS